MSIIFVFFLLGKLTLLSDLWFFDVEFPFNFQKMKFPTFHNIVVKYSKPTSYATAFCVILAGSSLVGCVLQWAERRSWRSELSLSYDRLTADGWPLMWINHTTVAFVDHERWTTKHYVHWILFLTGSLVFTPKTTEQNLIARNGKSEGKVTV